jgi:hypothetical protein
MEKFPKTLIVLAVISLIIAVAIKITTLGKILPGPIPINWAKLADTLLLFAIAISLLGKK